MTTDLRVYLVLDSQSLGIYKTAILLNIVFLDSIKIKYLCLKITKCILKISRKSKFSYFFSVTVILLGCIFTLNCVYVCERKNEYNYIEPTMYFKKIHQYLESHLEKKNLI